MVGSVVVGYRSYDELPRPVGLGPISAQHESERLPQGRVRAAGKPSSWPMGAQARSGEEPGLRAVIGQPLAERLPEIALLPPAPPSAPLPATTRMQRATRRP